MNDDLIRKRFNVYSINVHTLYQRAKRVGISNMPELRGIKVAVPIHTLSEDASATLRREAQQRAYDVALMQGICGVVIPPQYEYKVEALLLEDLPEIVLIRYDESRT